MWTSSDSLGGESGSMAASSPGAGLSFGPARELGDVLEAWGLVYHGYRRAGLIPANRWRLHFVPHAIQSRALVICGRLGGRTVSTLSAYFDAPDGGGLPLDAIYGAHLRRLREAGRVLLEIGLFADRREFIERSVSALLELMRHACYFGLSGGGTDAVIGVHPRHVAFYQRTLGFEPMGPERRHPMVANHPVVLLRLNWGERIVEPRLPRGLAYFRGHPMAAEAFEGRCSLDPASIRGTKIERMLASGESPFIGR